MLKQYADLFRRLMILADLCLVTGCFFAAYAIRNHMTPGLLPLAYYLPLWPVITLLWVSSLYFVGMYKSFRFKLVSDILAHIFQSALLSLILFGFIAYVFKMADISRSLVFLIFGLSIAALLIEKLLLVVSFRMIRRKGFNFRNILVVGTNSRAQKFINKINMHRDLGLKVIGVLDMDPEMTGQRICGQPVLGTLDDLPNILEREVIDYVIFIVPRTALDKVEPLIRHCEMTGTKVSVAVDLFNLKATRGQEDNMFGLPLVTFQMVTENATQQLLKRLMDIIVSAALICFLLPAHAAIFLLIKMTSPGNIFFVQERCGLQGRRFKLYKFRTMVADAEAQLDKLLDKNEMAGPAFKLSNDPRITPVGKFLRKYSLDELPQLWNVLRGDMSLVGPRPSLPREVEQYDHWQRRRLSMRPGITCLWQVNGRNTITDFDKWAKLDLEYIDNWSLGLDFKILLRTIPAVVSAKGAK